jgi:hypothetical protein
VYHGPPPPLPPPPLPPPRRGFLQFGVGGAIVVIAISVLGTCARIHNRKLDKDKSAIQADLPKVGAEGTLEKAPARAELCPPGKTMTGWPCSSGKATIVAPSSHVRVMKAEIHQMEGVCRYWVKGGPQDNASGDAPCEWFVAQ